ncbi:very-long-chain enoyl-CoA reductase-like [Dendronephthya gigantea]|uniref:very-long-chain enoyl-CoA reductase-like n=1 Tax=Dendronephthya gigantea TaxID=151771 RepID=UPI00106D5B69|nr:very-long-chain enoyl-CoA reductase-like [Dendronephthya gigantea]
MANKRKVRGETEELVNTRNDIQQNMDNDSASGYNPVFVNSLTYVGTLAFFILFLELPSLPTLPYPLNGSMLVSNDGDFAKNTNVKYLFITLWAIHFIRRTLEVLFVHNYKRRMPLVESVGAPIYYWFFAIWIAWSMRYKSGYEQSFMILVILGSVIFVIGEIGNCICHIQLRGFRNEKHPNYISSSSGHVLPHGLLFNYVSCPHYFFEIVTWIGFFFATWTLASVLFLLATILTLVTYAYKKHKAYVHEFHGNDGGYPPNRKALIPFIF